jgi:hypothetical protein
LFFFNKSIQWNFHSNFPLLQIINLPFCFKQDILWLWPLPYPIFPIISPNNHKVTRYIWLKCYLCILLH